MQQMGDCTKGCATCENWGGVRKVADAYGRRVEWDGKAKGRCLEHVFTGETDAYSNFTCQKWVKWRALAK